MPPPSCQTHVLNPLASQPRLTRGHLRFRRSLYLGGSLRGWPHYAPRGLTKLHRDVLRAYAATRTREGAVWRPTAHPADMSDP